MPSFRAREGPTGQQLLRLLWSIVSKPLPPEAVRFGVQVDEETRAARKIRAANEAGNANA